MTEPYFQDCTSEKEVHKRYRDCAKKVHPDIGGNEEEMKRLNDERSAALKRISAKKTENCDGAITVEGVEIVENILSKLGVGSRGISPGKPMTVTLDYGVAPSKVLKIESAIRAELGKAAPPSVWSTGVLEIVAHIKFLRVAASLLLMLTQRRHTCTMSNRQGIVKRLYIKPMRHMYLMGRTGRNGMKLTGTISACADT